MISVTSSSSNVTGISLLLELLLELSLELDSLLVSLELDLLLDLGLINNNNTFDTNKPNKKNIRSRL